MKKKYIIFLSIIAFLLVLTLTVGTGYGVWLSNKEPEETDTKTIDCFKIYYANNGVLEMNKIKPVLEEEGEATSPYTITITNICEEAKEVEIRLNTLEGTTVDTNALTLKTAGNIEVERILYKNLETTKTKESKTKISKLIGKTVIEPNETIRANLRIWFDERKLPNITPETNYFKGYIEILDSAKAIKPTIYESIMKDPKAIESKEAPVYTEVSITEEGLYVTNAPGGKYYYYRGVANNNYVKFANLTWRIVGINPDKTLKLVLDKSSASIQYSTHSNYMDYTGFKYDYNKDDVNNYLENWYKTNIADRGFDKYVVNYDFCNDSSSTADGKNTIFGAYSRLTDEAAPIVTCPETKLDFGGKYNQKVGLLTADDIALAGGAYNVPNYNYYLYNGGSFFTSSPAEFRKNQAYIMIVDNTGSLATDKTDSTHEIRPVINIDSSLTFEGSGTVNNPYVLNTK